MQNIQARLFINSIRYKDGTFPAMNKLKTDLTRQGYSKEIIHVGYAVAKGVFYCASCYLKVINPPSDFYGKDEFWRCKCGKINFIKKSYNKPNN